ncbi:protein phosphatase 2C family protein [Wolffia australiana]
MSFTSLLSQMMREPQDKPDSAWDLNVSFDLQCSPGKKTNKNKNANTNMNKNAEICEFEICPGSQIQSSEKIMSRSNSSFSCLSGAALSANATLANTNIGNGYIGEGILPGLDSPKSFKRLSSSPSLSRLDLQPSSSQSSMSTENEPAEPGKSGSAPTRLESYHFLNGSDVQLAGGAAGEDRVQAVCSEENGWVFCGVYDGFNGRDAADFLAGTFYDKIALSLQMLEWHMKQEVEEKMKVFGIDEGESYRDGVLKSLTYALGQAEKDFMYMVEQEMENRPDLVSIGSSVLAMLLHGLDLYILNLGDSRAVLASNCNGYLKATQLTEIHSVDNEAECKRVIDDHPDDPMPIHGGRLKGKLKLTRALGVGYLKKSKLNNMLMGILRVRNLISPPYVYTNPFTTYHRVTEDDLFVVLGSDGLFDLFSNEDVVGLVHQFVQDHPFGEPAKFLIEQLVSKVAELSGLTVEELLRIPVGRRRKYHDDVTVIVIILGNKQRMSAASTSL